MKKDTAFSVLHSDFLNNYCDGAGPHIGPPEVRVYPIGGDGNLILCHHCWAYENRFRYERGRETGQPENWPQLNWYQAATYTKETT